MSDLPARLVTGDLVPPEHHLRPKRFPFFSRDMMLIFGLTVVSGVFFAGTTTWTIVLIGMIVWVVALVRRGSRDNVENQRGVDLLNAGEIELALETFEALARKRPASMWHALFVFNVGVAQLLMGRHQRAYSIFNAVAKSKQLESRGMKPFYPHLVIETGMCLVLAGNVQEALLYLEEARTLCPAPLDGRVVFLEVAVYARSGDFARAAEVTKRKWKRSEGSLRGPTLRALRILAAYSLDRAGQRGSTDFAMWVAGARPFEREDLHWVTAGWPELRAFVETL